jgi:hypothetical protein
VEKSGDKCPDEYGLPEDEGCPPTLISYFSDVDRDGIGDRIGERGIASPTQYEQGSQPRGWVEQDGDNCPYVSNRDQIDTDGDQQGDACEDSFEDTDVTSPQK